MYLSVPKKFVRGIRVPFGPLEGQLAEPCICGYETSLDQIFEEGETLWLITHNDRLIFCHEECIPPPPNNFDDD